MIFKVRWMFYLKRLFFALRTIISLRGKILVYLLCFVVALGCFVFVPCRFYKNILLKTYIFQCLVLHQELDFFASVICIVRRCLEIGERFVSF